MIPRLKDKIALVTGGGSGIGRATCLRMAEEGASVVVTDMNEAGGHETVAQITASGGAAWFDRLDVADEAGWQGLIAAIRARHGRLDILVNNAGILIMKPMLETSLDEWERIFAVNARGVFLGCKTAAPVMIAAGGGAIINISSIYGLIAPAGATAYEATKGAVRLFTKGVAAELAAHNIRVNSVHPGVVDTGMTEAFLRDAAVTDRLLGPTLIRRPAQARELANAILFLASDEASYMTGSELVVDGGYTSQ
ncbi:MAG: Cyclopentanol dehydrogenase [Rhodocyclaceae bacterium]|nr:Cyclopentanol dehydrogenase [Rhodocyclaceae bacterium]